MGVSGRLYNVYTLLSAVLTKHKGWEGRGGALSWNASSWDEWWKVCVTDIHAAVWWCGPPGVCGPAVPEWPAPPLSPVCLRLWRHCRHPAVCAPSSPHRLTSGSRFNGLVCEWPTQTTLHTHHLNIWVRNASSMTLNCVVNQLMIITQSHRNSWWR